jgi:hypothetical protein
VAVVTTLGAGAGSISTGLATWQLDGLLDLGALSNGEQGVSIFGALPF